MLDFSRFSALSFDCYGTMIDWEAGIFSALRPILAAHDKRIDEVTLLKMYSELELEAERDEYLSYREVLHAVVRGFGKRLGFDPTEA
jgi:2-haloacid dehalogenase